MASSENTSSINARAPGAPLLSVIIPAFNEEGRLPHTLRHICEYLAAKEYRSEVIVVDDGSRDHTAKVAREFASEVRVVVNEANRGKGYSVRRGFTEARGEFALFTDADLSTPIEEFDQFLPLLKDGHDIVFGSRALPGSRIEVHQPWLREMGGRFFNILVRRATLPDFHDTQCGFKAFSRRAREILIPRQTMDGWSFDLELLYIAKKHGLRLKEQPVRWRNSPDTKVSFVKDASKMFREIFKIKRNDRAGMYD